MKINSKIWKPKYQLFCDSKAITSLQIMDGSIIKHDGTLGEFFPEFVWILIESHWNYQGIQM